MLRTQMCAVLFVSAALLLPAALCPLYYRSGGVSTALPSTTATRAGVGGPATAGLWAPVVAAYFLFLLLAYLLRRTQRHLLRLRLECAGASVADAPESYAVLLNDIPSRHRTAQDVQAFFQRLFPEVVATHGDAFPLVVMAPPTEEVEPAWLARNRAATTAHAARAAMRRAQPEAPPWTVDWKILGEDTRAQAALAEAERSLASARARALSAQSAAAFVIFPTRIAAATAASAMLLSASGASSGGRWHLVPAPPPEAVQWPALQLRPWTRAVRRALATLAAAVVVLSFLFVVAAVSSLVSLQSLQSAFPSVVGPVASSRIAPLVDGYLAVAALLACLYAAPPCLKALTHAATGHLAGGDADASAARSFLWLCFVDVFLGAAAIQALLREVSFAISAKTGATVVGLSWSDVATALGGSVPGAAPFFIVLCLARAGSSMAATLLRAADLPLIAWRLSRAHTVQAERAAWAPQPPPFVDWGPSALFILFLGLVYAPISPLICFPVAAYFALGTVVFRLQLLYVYAPSGRGANRLWLHLRDGVLDAALLALAVLAAVLALHGAVAETSALLLLLIAAALASTAARNDDNTAAFLRLPRDVAAAADAKGGALVAGALPFPLPEAFHPRCMYDDRQALPDESRGREAAERDALAALRAGPTDRQHRAEDVEERAPLLARPAPQPQQPREMRYGATQTEPPRRGERRVGRTQP